MKEEKKGDRGFPCPVCKEGRMRAMSCVVANDWARTQQLVCNNEKCGHQHVGVSFLVPLNKNAKEFEGRYRLAGRIRRGEATPTIERKKDE